jgi:predicted dehydrogenase
MSTSRRQFIKQSAVFAIPVIIPAAARGADGKVAPSNRITVGSVGWGMQGPGNTNSTMGLDNAKVLAVCDLDKKHLASAKQSVDKFYNNTDCAAYADYQEMMARKDIDAVTLAVPDHWHALIAIAAAKSGKHIWGEKPLARTIAEQQAIVKAVQDSKVIWQTGSWQRSVDNFTKAVELVRGGYIGEIKEVQVGLPSGHNDFAGTKDRNTVTPPPPHLDYDKWVGPSEMIDYIEARVHKNWRWHYNFGGGQLLDWVGHHVDIAHWGLNFDRSGPTSVECQGEFPAPDALWNTCTKYRGELQYPNNVKMTIAGGHGDIAMGTKWIGSEGWVYVNRGAFDSSNAEWKRFRVLPENMRKAEVERSGNHFKNWIDCALAGKPTITPVETAHRSAIPGHLCLISMLTKSKVQWDAAKEEIVDNAAASKLLTRGYRAPYQLG